MKIALTALRNFCLKLAILFGVPVPVGLVPRHFLYQAIFGRGELSPHDDTFENWDRVRIEFHGWIGRFAIGEMIRTASRMEDFLLSIKAGVDRRSPILTSRALESTLAYLGREGIDTASPSELRKLGAILRGSGPYLIKGRDLIRAFLECYAKKDLMAMDFTAMSLLAREFHLFGWTEDIYQALEMYDGTRLEWEEAIAYTQPNTPEQELCEHEIANSPY